MGSFPPPIPKPTNAGTPKTAIAHTKASYANIRQGPGTHYKDIGDLRNLTLASYYPATKRNTDWVWVEQYGTGGWVTMSVVTFEDALAPAPPVPMKTPYDGKIGLWHWRGDSVGENTIEEVCETIQRYAPHVTQLYVKTSDYTPSTGPQWMGYWDNKRALAIDGPASIDKWVSVLAKYKMEFHAWCVPRGADIDAETNLIIQACQRPGVQSMILDVEPYAGFWMGGKAAIRPFMTKIRRALPGSFHIGMTVDPRPQHFAAIFPMEWFPFINSIHPQDYWATFRKSPDETLAQTFEVWGNFGRPIIPALQGDANPVDMRAAHTLATQKYGVRGVSWWRFGVLGPSELAAINQPIKPGTTAPVPNSPPVDDQYVDEQIVRPGDGGFSFWSYTGKQEEQTFTSVWGWPVKWKKSEAQKSKVSARWTPVIPQSGRYEISTFVPARHATTKNARFKLHGVKNQPSELLVPIDQSIWRDAWVRLGVFEIEKSAVNAGVVFLNDLTGETDKEIAFDAIRWRRVVPGTTVRADGFDPPIGTESERRGAKVWPGKWYDASPFGKLYFVGTPSEAYHTGADLNLPRDADKHASVYAVASGVVTFAARLPTWGNVVIIRHDPMTVGGLIIYSRSAHVEDMKVRPGDRVTRGQEIAKVSNAYGRYAYHLHFDLSATTILETNPEHWPGKNYDGLFGNYIDPKEWIMANRPPKR